MDYEEMRKRLEEYKTIKPLNFDDQLDEWII